MNQKPHHRINVETLIFSDRRPSAKYSQQVRRTFTGGLVDGISRPSSNAGVLHTETTHSNIAMLTQQVELHKYSFFAQRQSTHAYKEIKTNLLRLGDVSLQNRTKDVFKKIDDYSAHTPVKRSSHMGLVFAGLFLFVGIGVGVFSTLFVSSQRQSGSVLSLGTVVDEGVNIDDADITTPIPHTGSIPRRIEIASLDIAADIRSVGITQTGAVAVTPRLNEVGWYKNSRAPGDGGTSLLVGHYNSNRPAVFQHLKDIQVGDYIDIERSDNVMVKYRVISHQVYDKQDMPMQDILSSDSNKALLKIITCEGLWLKDEHTYSKRLLVTAEQV